MGIYPLMRPPIVLTSFDPALRTSPLPVRMSTIPPQLQMVRIRIGFNSGFAIENQALAFVIIVRRPIGQARTIGVASFGHGYQGI